MVQAVGDGPSADAIDWRFSSQSSSSALAPIENSNVPSANAIDWRSSSQSSASAQAPANSSIHDRLRELSSIVPQAAVCIEDIDGLSAGLAHLQAAAYANDRHFVSPALDYWSEQVIFLKNFLAQRTQGSLEHAADIVK